MSLKLFLVKRKNEVRIFNTSLFYESFILSLASVTPNHTEIPLKSVLAPLCDDVTARLRDACALAYPSVGSEAELPSPVLGSGKFSAEGVCVERDLPPDRLHGIMRELYARIYHGDYNVEADESRAGIPLTVRFVCLNSFAGISFATITSQ